MCGTATIVCCMLLQDCDERPTASYKLCLRKFCCKESTYREVSVDLSTDATTDPYTVRLSAKAEGTVLDLLCAALQ